MNKYIFLALLLAFSCSQSILTMDASKEELNQSLIEIIDSAHQMLKEKKNPQTHVEKIRSLIGQGADVNTQTRKEEGLPPS